MLFGRHGIRGQEPLIHTPKETSHMTPKLSIALVLTAANFAVAYFENTQPFLPVAVELSLRRLGIAHWHLGAVYLVLSFLFFLIVCNSVEKIYRAYFRKEKPYRGPVNLPLWPEPTGTLHFVMGEMHDPRTGHMVKKPTWLVIPESGLYTNVFITGATGSRKDR